ncbi:MAG: radical SAM protein [Thermoanaerobaculaceae bacterium]|nr:radical SAM protein [Thermoanaerobaculaceae bacterium]
MSGLRVRQGAALLRDWAAPGSAIAQWTHFVTSTCNARCKHCFYPINQRKNELTLDEIARLMQTMPPIRLLLISGGEPFLRRDLPDVMRVYFENCGFFSASIPTNGFNAKVIAQSVEKICSISPDLHLGVAVSIDGFAEFHDTMRAVPGIYGKALETLEAMVELSRRFPNLTASVNTVFMRDNQGEVEAFCDFIHERYRPTYHALVLIRGDAYDPTLKENLDVDLYVRISEKLDQRYPPSEMHSGWRGVRARARQEINRRRYEYIARQAKGGGFERFCLAGEREYVMTETGDVYGCELISHKLGNVREVGYDFGVIRKGAEAERFVREKHGRLCRCTHECNTRTLILFDRKNALPVLGAMLGVTKRK